MLRHMAGASLTDAVAYVVVASRCGVKLLALVIPESRLNWYDYVNRPRSYSVLGEVIQMEVVGTWPLGRQKKPWKKNIDVDMCDWKKIDA